MTEWNQAANAVFVQAIELATANERASFLNEACGDDANLRGQVERLLKAHNHAGSFLEQPADVDFAPTIATGQFDTLDDGGAEISLDFLRPSGKPGCLGLVGQYEVVDVVGRGGMGLVLRAHDPKLNRIVAIKVMAPELAANAMAVKRFSREAKAAAAVSHDHVVTIHAIEDSNKPPFIVMEFVDGQSLQEKIDDKGALEPEEILRIGMQIAAGVASAHKQGLIHRDIKPANILLENSLERVKITDFGLARAVDDIGITQTGQITGTPQYMSPEQAQGQPVDTRTDLFSLGSVLYTMCTGRPAFCADNAVAVLRRVSDEEPRPIRELNSEILEWLCDIVYKLVEKKREDRFDSAQEVSDLLAGHLAHLQHPESVSPPERVRPSTSHVARDCEKKLRSTANWLWAAGILSLVSSGLAVVMFVRILVGQSTPPWAWLFIASGLISLPCSFLILIGARHAETRKSHSWANTAAKLSMLPLNAFLVFTIPVAISTFLWLRRPDVRDLFIASDQLGRQRRGRVAIAFGVAAILTGIAVLGTVIYIQTDYATVRVEVLDLDAKVMLRCDRDQIIEIKDYDVTLRVRPGENSLQIKHGDLEFETDNFTIQRGDKVHVRVSRVYGRLEVRIGDTIIGRQPLAKRLVSATNLGPTILYTISQEGDLYRVNVFNRSFEMVVVKKLGAAFGDAEGLTMTDDGKLFAAVNGSNDSSDLYFIDVETGVASKIGPMGFNEVDGLAWRYGQLYAVTSRFGGYQGRLLEVDPSSGKARPIGKHLPLNDLDSLTFDARGRLLTTDGMGLDDKIYQLDRQGFTAPTPLAPTPPIIESSRDIEGLTFAADGRLYGVTHPNPEKRGPRKSYLVRIDPTTFEYQNLGVLSFGTFCIAADLRKSDVVPVQD